MCSRDTEVKGGKDVVSDNIRIKTKMNKGLIQQLYGGEKV